MNFCGAVMATTSLKSSVLLNMATSRPLPKSEGFETLPEAVLAHMADLVAAIDKSGLLEKANRLFWDEYDLFWREQASLFVDAIYLHSGLSQDELAHSIGLKGKTNIAMAIADGSITGSARDCLVERYGHLAQFGPGSERTAMAMIRAIEFLRSQHSFPASVVLDRATYEWVLALTADERFWQSIISGTLDSISEAVMRTFRHVSDVVTLSRSLWSRPKQLPTFGIGGGCSTTGEMKGRTMGPKLRDRIPTVDLIQPIAMKTLAEVLQMMGEWCAPCVLCLEDIASET